MGNGEGADKGVYRRWRQWCAASSTLNASHEHWYLWPDPHTCIGTEQRYSAKNMINPCCGAALRRERGILCVPRLSNHEPESVRKF